MKISLALILLLSIFISSCFAYRPFFTWEASVLDKGGYTLEPGMEYSEDSNIDTKTTTFLMSTSYGILPGSEITLIAPFTSTVTQGTAVTGFGDANFGWKASLCPNFSLILNLKLANGDVNNGLGTGNTNLSVIGAYDIFLGSSTIFANLGYTMVGGGENNYIASAAMVNPLNQHINIISELYGESTLNGSDFTMASLGTNWALEDLVFDISLRRSFNDSLNTLVYGLTYEYEPQ